MGYNWFFNSRGNIHSRYKKYAISKKKCPKALIVAGGIEAQFNYQNVLDKTPCKIVFISEVKKSFGFTNDKPFNEIPGIVYKNSSVPLDQGNI